MNELLTLLVRGLVTDAHRVVVREKASAGATLFELEVARADRGRVIGRGGQTLSALRTLLGAVAARRGESCAIEIVD